MKRVSDTVPRKAETTALPAQAAGVDVFPLSFSQEGLWLFEQMTPGTSAYNLPQAWRFNGPLKPAALEAALGAIFARHETLRTVFSIIEEQPRQIVQPVQHTPLPIVDLSEGTNPEVRLRAALDIEAQRRFDLSSGPLARTRLFRLGPEEHVLLLNLHHIISDEWSMKVFLDELAAHYQALVLADPALLPELPIQYADFAVWQRSRFTAGLPNQSLDYWRAQLRGPRVLLDLPSDRPRPSHPSYNGATLFSELPQDLLMRLKDLAGQERLTLFMVLTAAFKALLLRYTRQTDVLIGSPVSGRTRTETEGLIGLFVNTLPLRTDLGGDPSFSELLHRVRETVLEAYAHQEIPLEKVVEAVNPARDPARHPLFPVVFGLQPPLAPIELSPGLRATRIELDNGGAKFDWTLLLTEVGRTLHIRCEYNTDVFEKPTLLNRLRQFETLLRGAVNQPSRRISQLPLLSTSERCELLSERNPGATVPSEPICLHEWFARQARATPDNIAVVLGPERFTYHELDARANRLARLLQTQGVKPEITVALYLDRSLEMIIAILAVLKAGGVYVPIDPGYPRERMSFILEDSKAHVIITQESLIAALPATTQPIVCVEPSRSAIDSEVEEEPVSGAVPSNAAYIIYTSGSTGRPKGVIVTHENVVRLFRQTQAWFDFQSRDVWTLFHSYAFDFSVWEIWGALLHGGRLVLVPYLVSRDPAKFYRLLAQEGVTVLNQTPSAFRQLLWAEQTAATQSSLNLRYVIFGGEALELQSLRPWFERHGDQCPTLVNMYGITETTVHVTYREIRKADLDAASGSVIGIPIPDLRVLLLDDNLEPVPTGVPGEICVAGAGVARGYLNRPELTAQRFIPHPFNGSEDRLYRSGDLARYTSSGELEYLGRIDDQVKIRGFRVELGEIESALNRHPGVRHCAVVARSCQRGDLRLMAYLVPVNAAPSVPELRLFLRQALPEYMVPSDFVWLDSLPLTPNGKLDRNALPLPAPAAPSLPAAPPETPLEKLTARIWCDVLGCPSVGADDNFFQIGGHSLLATQVMSRLAAALEMELSVVLLFEAPTVRSLAEALARAQSEQPPGIESIPRRPLSSPRPAPEPLLKKRPDGDSEAVLPLAQRLNFLT